MEPEPAGGTLTEAQRYTEFKWNKEKNMFSGKHMELLKDKELRPGVSSSLATEEEQVSPEHNPT